MSDFATYRAPDGTRYIPTTPETERLVLAYRSAMYAWGEETMRDRGWSGEAEDQARQRVEAAQSAMLPWIRYGRIIIERPDEVAA